MTRLQVQIVQDLSFENGPINSPWNITCSASSSCGQIVNQTTPLIFDGDWDVTLGGPTNTYYLNQVVTFPDYSSCTASLEFFATITEIAANDHVSLCAQVGGESNCFISDSSELSSWEYYEMDVSSLCKSGDQLLSISFVVHNESKIFIDDVTIIVIDRTSTSSSGSSGSRSSGTVTTGITTSSIETTSSTENSTISTLGTSTSSTISTTGSTTSSSTTSASTVEDSTTSTSSSATSGTSISTSISSTSSTTMTTTSKGSTTVSETSDSAPMLANYATLFVPIVLFFL